MPLAAWHILVFGEMVAELSMLCDYGDDPGRQFTAFPNRVQGTRYIHCQAATGVFVS